MICDKYTQKETLTKNNKTNTKDFNQFIKYATNRCAKINVCIETLDKDN